MLFSSESGLWCLWLVLFGSQHLAVLASYGFNGQNFGNGQANLGRDYGMMQNDGYLQHAYKGRTQYQNDAYGEQPPHYTGNLQELSSRELQKLKWWKDVQPSRLKSRWEGRLPHVKRPPNLMSPGVFNFRLPQSTTYYFHNQGARIIKSSHFMKRYHLGRKISFVCVAQGQPRPQITWLKDGLELNSYAGYEGVGINEWRSGKDRVKSKLEIDPAMPKDAGFYECLGDNKFAIDRRGFIAKYELN